MHLTQPAVSIQIGILEESAGTPLLQRTGRGIRLTEAGELLARYAGRILNLWREAGEEMAHSGVFSGTLRMGAVTTVEFLLLLLVTFANDNPKVKVKLRVGNRDEIVRLLASHDIDLAIMGRPPGELKTISTPFARRPMAFIAAPDHPLMTDPEIGLASLAEANTMVRERGSGTRTTVERLFKDAKDPAAHRVRAVQQRGHQENVHGPAGPVRDEWMTLLRELLPPSTLVRRVPLHVHDPIFLSYLVAKAVSPRFGLGAQANIRSTM